MIFLVYLPIFFSFLVETKLELLNELVAVHGLDHVAIEDELVGRWLTSDASVGCSLESVCCLLIMECS